MVVIKGLADLEATDCIRNGVVVYETNADELASAQEAVQSALEDLTEYELEQEIENLEDQLESLGEYYEEQYDLLQEYADKWSEISTHVTNVQEALTATQYLGEDWVLKVLTGNDDDIFECFKDLYETNAEEISQLETQITTTENISALLDEYITAYQEGTLTFDEAYASIENLLTQMTDEMTTGQNVTNILEYLAQVNDTEATVQSVLEGIQSALTESSDELLSNLILYEENNGNIEELQTTWDELVNNVEEIRDYAADILDAIENLDFSDLYDDDEEESESTWSEENHSWSDPFFATGLERGVIGKTNSEIADDVITLGTQPLKKDEVPIIAHEGELIINPDQQSQILKNFELASFNPLAGLNTTPVFQGVTPTTPSFEVTIGDIILPDVTDPDGFAKAMGAQIQSAFRQTLGSIRF